MTNIVWFLFLFVIFLSLCSGAVINIQPEKTDIPIPVTLSESTATASDSVTGEAAILDPVNATLTEGEIPETKVDERAVGRALNWLRTRENFIHADKSYLDEHPKHTVLPWGK